MAKYYGYARVSTEEQSDISIDNQLKFLKQRAKHYEMEFIEYSEKKSGKSLKDRPILQEIQKSLSNGDILGVWDQSRLFRDEIESLNFLSVLEKKGASLEMNGQLLDSNNYTDLLQFSLLSSINAYFRRIQNDKSRQSIIRLKEKGDWIFTSRLFGYNLIKESGDKIRIEINEKEAEIIRYIFNEYSNGLSINKICKNLNLAGYKSRNKKEFHPATIRRYILKPIYMGYYYKDTVTEQNSYQKADLHNEELINANFYPEIITPELWWNVNNSYKQVDRSHAIQFKYRWSGYKLSSIVRCGYCNNTYVHSFHKSKTGKINSNYVCRTHGKDCTQNFHTFRESILDELFNIIYFLYYYNLKDVIQYEIKIDEEYNMLSIKRKEELKRIEEHIYNIKKQQNKLLDVMLMSDDMPKEIYKERAQRLSSELSRYQLNKENLTHIIEHSIEDYYDKRTEDISDEYDHFLNDTVQGQRAELLHILTAKVFDSKIIIKYNHGSSIEIKLEKNKGRVVQKTFEIVFIRKEKVSFQCALDLNTKTIKILPPYYKNENKEINNRYEKSYFATNIGILKELLSKTNNYYKEYNVL